MAVRRQKTILSRTRAEIKLASARAESGGGSAVGPCYVRALEDMGRHLHQIQEMGVHLKDVDKGLCDFPYALDDRIVFLCWKLGEQEVGWWHEVNAGIEGRTRIEGGVL